MGEDKQSTRRCCQVGIMCGAPSACNGTLRNAYGETRSRRGRVCAVGASTGAGEEQRGGAEGRVNWARNTAVVRRRDERTKGRCTAFRQPGRHCTAWINIKAAPSSYMGD
eukprot:1186991-Prorocentrum_minimum.AAC.2